MLLSASRTLLLLATAGSALARSLWSSSPATYGPKDSDGYILKTGYPLGNGRLGAIPFGPPGAEKINVNVDSLWSGGPFEAANYTGGNPTEPKYEALQGIRAEIFEHGTGDATALTNPNENYGSYRVLGNLTVTMEDISEVIGYKRVLDLKTGVYTSTFSSQGEDFETKVFCSYPDSVCVYEISSSGKIPELAVSFENQLVVSDLVNATCEENAISLNGITQQGSPEGMKYHAMARLLRDIRAKTECGSDGILKVIPSEGQRSVTLVLGAGTNYDTTQGTEESNFSFRGADPGNSVRKTLSMATSKTSSSLLRRHIRDYSSLEAAFELDLPDPRGSARRETSDIIQDYEAQGPGNPFLEALLFDFSRYLLISSSRDNSLPANLQGRWTEELAPAWSSDYHTNINIQMNYWPAEQTGLGKTTDALWEYMSRTWVPRGTQTAQLLYNASGWTVHNEVNIFGHTSMKNDPNWANYPLAPAWLMQHVWDHYEYTNDHKWLRDVGYPLIKGVAEFWASQVVPDNFTKDGTLVAVPCNSPEHGPTTFGCAHWQQEIHSVFNMILRGAPIVKEDDHSLINRIKSTMDKLDKGVHYESNGRLKEWKVPYSYLTDTIPQHRHLSHLSGWFPGYAVSSFLEGFTDTTIQDGVRDSLVERGTGTGPDADAGWAKVWRSACWARLNDTEKAYFELRYAIDRNFAANGLSMYSALNPPFQIDANFGFGGAVLSMLVVDLPLPSHVETKDVRTVVLGPAIPSSWAGGRVRGLRIRGGGIVDFSWDDEGLVTKARCRGSKTRVRLVNKEGEVLAKA